MYGGAARAGHSKMHEPHRLCAGRATRPRDPCDGDRHIRSRMTERPFRHRHCDWRADSTVRLQKLDWNTQRLGFGLVRICHKAPIEHGPMIGHISDRGRHQPPPYNFPLWPLLDQRQPYEETIPLAISRMSFGSMRRFQSKRKNRCLARGTGSKNVAPNGDARKAQGSDELFRLLQQCIERTARLPTHHRRGVVLRVLPTGNASRSTA